MSEMQRPPVPPSPPSTPRWVIVFVVILILLVAIVIIVHLMGFRFDHGTGTTLVKLFASLIEATTQNL